MDSVTVKFILGRNSEIAPGLRIFWATPATGKEIRLTPFDVLHSTGNSALLSQNPFFCRGLYALSSWLERDRPEDIDSWLYLNILMPEFGNELGECGKERGETVVRVVAENGWERFLQFCINRIPAQTTDISASELPANSV